MKRRLLRLACDCEAATAVEYAVMLGMIIVICIGAVLVVGQNTATLWSDNSDGLQKAFSGTP
jgi:Flp pilus assembly pilin Flp